MGYFIYFLVGLFWGFFCAQKTGDHPRIQELSYYSRAGLVTLAFLINGVAWPISMIVAFWKRFVISTL